MGYLAQEFVILCCRVSMLQPADGLMLALSWDDPGQTEGGVCAVWGGVNSQATALGTT